VNEDVRIEFNQRVELVAMKTETEGEENDINPDQLRIAVEFEKRPKPPDVALDELMSGKLNWRYREKRGAAAGGGGQHPRDRGRGVALACLPGSTFCSASPAVSRRIRPRSLSASW